MAHVRVIHIALKACGEGRPKAADPSHFEDRAFPPECDKAAGPQPSVHQLCGRQLSPVHQAQLQLASVANGLLHADAYSRLVKDGELQATVLATDLLLVLIKHKLVFFQNLAACIALFIFQGRTVQQSIALVQQSTCGPGTLPIN